ncbi:MAG: DUF192 domain-containing protein [Candidatus Doudnabacteria bacterium]|nr:DUF192 domain-containing protein [Candidatus Doudnabacteria bacterium]
MNKTNLTITITITITVLILIALNYGFKEKNKPGSYVTIAGKKISVEIADDSFEYVQGLSGSASLGEDKGMLFLLWEKSSAWTFWMKDMNFPIDIVWIDADTVVDITRNVQPQPGAPDEQLMKYSPSQRADTVLEINAGWAERNGLKIGDKITLNLND